MKIEERHKTTTRVLAEGLVTYLDNLVKCPKEFCDQFGDKACCYSTKKYYKCEDYKETR